ncbi:MAG: hypothetical protein GY784_15755 [Gammaproteobacteria bacterium]|nr:hypothetical protein [Gammaproteobacteria bacterium]
MQNLSLGKQASIFISEAIEKRVFVSIVFSVTSVTVLLTGLYWPKVYESSVSILWTTSVLEQEGGAYKRQSTANDQLETARQTILSNKILNTIMQMAGLGINKYGEKLSERELDDIRIGMRSKIRLSLTGTQLLVVSYRSTDAEMAYQIISIVSELFLTESREVKNATSQGAFDFIDRQVNDYKNKLDTINREIIGFRKSNVDLDSDTRQGVNRRVNNLKSIVRDTTLQLTEIRVKKQSLEEQLLAEKLKIEKQLLLESRLASSVVRESANGERLRRLQTTLDTLRLSYTENYPDIIQVKEQIKNLKAQIEQEKEIYTSSTSKNAHEFNSANINFIESPWYSRLSSEIADAETIIQTMKARIDDSNVRLDQELLRANKVNTLESQLEKMTRDMAVTQEIYDSLLTRRENARVSLNLQLEDQGSTFKIYEPASVPLVPVGLRFVHFLLGCIPVGLLVPLALIFGFLMVDSRIRHEDSLDSEVFGIPVIGVIEHFDNDIDKRVSKRNTIISMLFFLAAIAVISAVVVNRYNLLDGI